MGHRPELSSIKDRRLSQSSVLLASERIACRVSSCSNKTSDRKPFCLEHLDHMPYVRVLVAQDDERFQGAAFPLRGTG